MLFASVKIKSIRIILHLQIFLCFYVLCMHNFGIFLHVSIFERALTSNEIFKIIFLLFSTAFLEEVFFRWGIYRLIAKKKNKLTASIITNTIFALMHYEYGLVGMLNAGLVGLYLTLIFVESGSLLFVSFLHFLLNLTQSWMSGFEMPLSNYHLTAIPLKSEVTVQYITLIVTTLIVMVLSWVASIISLRILQK